MKKSMKLLCVAGAFFGIFALASCRNADPVEQGKLNVQSSSWLTGEGAPVAEEGVTGDYYLDFSQGAVYQKEEGGWQLRGILPQPEIPAESVSVTFDANEGTLPEGVEQTLVLKKGSSVALPLPHREGYTFLGWFFGEGANGGQANDLTVFARDVTLTASWWKDRTVTLTEESVSVKKGDGLSLEGDYDGGSVFTMTVLLEKDGVSRSPEEAAATGMIASYQLVSGNHFSIFMQVLEAGEFTLKVEIAENGFAVGSSVRVTVLE